MDHPLTDGPTGSRAPAVFAIVVALAAAAVVPWMQTPAGPSTAFLPAVLALVACFDLLSVYLLVHQYRSEGEPRSLAMAFAYTWSLVVMVGYAAAFPGVAGDPAPFATAPSVAPWLYVSWHTGFPVLLALAWAPCPARWVRTTPPPARVPALVLSQLLALLAAAALVAVVVATGPELPVLIDGLDLSRMTALTAPVSLPLVLLSVLVTVRGVRGRSGPERWTSVAVFVCLVDLLLTYASNQRFSTGWYAGRTLTVIAAGVVLLAMLAETTRTKAVLHSTLERERAVERLQRSILENLRDAVVLTGLDGRVLMVNEAARRMFPDVQHGRVPPVRVVRTADGALLPPQDRPAAVTARTGESLRDVVLVAERPGAPAVWLSANTSTVDDEAGVPVAVLASYADVTARERARQQLESTAEQLSAAHDAAVSADRAKSGFLAATSHEIRTPLNGILGMTRLLSASELDPRQRELVGTAQTCGEQLLALVSDVLDFSKAEAGQLELDRQPLDLAQLVDDCTGMIGGTAREQGLALTAVVAPDVHPWVVGDALRLRQVLLNLLSNAVKFTPTGGVTLHVTADGELVRFAVSDTGIGVDPESVPHLFRPFTQADAGTTRRYGGTGLGLAITRQVAQLHDGAVGAAPREDTQGSTFWFTARLPVSTSPRPDAPVADRERRARLRGRVLVAEDNVVNQLVATLMLEGLGLTVDVVADGRAALAAAEGGGYDLVLMDCQMPEMDGLQAARALRGRGCRTPVLALTASASRQDELACRDAGMDDYLTKPIDPQALTAALRRHLPRQPHPS